MPATGKDAADPANGPAIDLTITRTFNAPRELVYKLFTEPEHIMHWMGPRDFEPRSFTQDARVGGTWRGMLHPIKGGKDLWQGGRFLAIDAPAHVSYTFAWEDDNGKPQNETIVTLDFESMGKSTRVTFHQSGFPSRGERDGHNEGWNQTFDKLEEYIASTQKETAS